MIEVVHDMAVTKGLGEACMELQDLVEGEAEALSVQAEAMGA